MSKQFRFYLVVFLGMLLAAIILHLTSDNSTLSKKSTGFAIDDTNHISAISIRHKGAEIQLEKISHRWYVNNEFPADGKQMFNFLRALANLRIKSPVALAEQEKIMNLLISEGAEIKIKKRWRTGRFRVYYPEGGPTYMVLGNSRSPFLVEVPGLLGEVGELFTTDAGFWRENVVFTFVPGQISGVLVDYPSGMGEGFRITLDENNRHLVYSLNSSDPLQFSTDSLVFSYLTYFSYVSYNRLLSADEPVLLDSLRSQVPFARIAVTGINSELTAISLFLVESDEHNGEYDPNILYGLINNDNDLVVISFVNVDLLLKEVSWFMQNPL